MRFNSRSVFYSVSCSSSRSHSLVLRFGTARFLQSTGAASAAPATPISPAHAQRQLHATTATTTVATGQTGAAAAAIGGHGAADHGTEMAGVVPADYNAGDAARAAVSARDVIVRVDLGFGPGSARAIGCDLSYDYVKINAEYTT